MTDTSQKSNRKILESVDSATSDILVVQLLTLAAVAILIFVAWPQDRVIVHTETKYQCQTVTAYGTSYVRDGLCEVSGYYEIE